MRVQNTYTCMHTYIWTSCHLSAYFSVLIFYIEIYGLLETQERNNLFMANNVMYNLWTNLNYFYFSVGN
jgi:hypothetical protein